MPRMQHNKEAWIQVDDQDLNYLIEKADNINEVMHSLNDGTLAAGRPSIVLALQTLTENWGEFYPKFQEHAKDQVRGGAAASA